MEQRAGRAAVQLHIGKGSMRSQSLLLIHGDLIKGSENSSFNMVNVSDVKSWVALRAAFFRDPPLL